MVYTALLKAGRRFAVGQEDQWGLQWGRRINGVCSGTRDLWWASQQNTRLAMVGSTLPDSPVGRADVCSALLLAEWTERGGLAAAALNERMAPVLARAWDFWNMYHSNIVEATKATFGKQVMNLVRKTTITYEMELYFH